MSAMHTLKFLVLAVVLSSAPLFAQQQQPPAAGALDQIVSKVASRETQEMAMIRQHAPLVETYIQKVRVSENDGTWVPDGDHYFIGRAEFSKGLDLKPLPAPNDDAPHRMVARLARLFDFGTEFLPLGFLQLIYLDNDGLSAQNYNFDYVHREFLGEVRTLVFDVTPRKKNAKGRFVGRIWVEDQDFTIVRFNGTYSGHEFSNLKFHFDSWRVNAGPNLWLPAFIYSEENTASYPLAKGHTYKAQTRLWGYDATKSNEEQELSQVLVESASPVIDQSQKNNDLTPLQEQRAWDEQAADNLVGKLEQSGLIAPRGEIDKVLDTVVNNLEITNNLEMDPEIRCRVLMTSTIESFSIGHTIVLSRGLIDVLPDEASLAAMLAKEIGYILTTHRRVDTRFAFYDRLQFSEQKIFQHFDFERKPEEDAAATAKAAELLKNSPYKDQLGTAEMFMAELHERAREIPNLISPRVGDAGLLKLPVAASAEGAESARHIVALPLGGRIKLNPWDDTLALLKEKAAGNVPDREKMPFEVTPFVIYLTRVGADSPKASQINTAPRTGD
jgi:outer membrane lipoprotein-sorting protein